MKSRDAALLRIVERLGGADYARIRDEYEKVTGRRLSHSAAIGRLAFLRKLGLVEAAGRVRQCPLYFPSGKRTA